MGQERLAPSKKNAARLSAHLVFIDESGLLMAPLVRRCWHPRGVTPVLEQRTRAHQKVSAIAAVCIPPTRDRVQLYFRLHPRANIDAVAVRAFLRELDRQLAAPWVLIWDRLQAHRARIVQAFLASQPHVRCLYLPPYAPDLNPVEYLWAHIKTNPLANAAYFDVDTLADDARACTRSVQHQPALLRSLVLHSPLPIRLMQNITYAGINSSSGDAIPISSRDSIPETATELGDRSARPVADFGNSPGTPAAAAASGRLGVTPLVVAPPFGDTEQPGQLAVRLPAIEEGLGGHAVLPR